MLSLLLLLFNSKRIINTNHEVNKISTISRTVSTEKELYRYTKSVMVETRKADMFWIKIKLEDFFLN